MPLFKALASKLPELRTTLRLARLPDTPEQYLRKIATISFMLAFALTLIAFGFTKSPLAILALPLIFVGAAAYTYRYAEYKVKKQASLINQELVYATRYLIIQLESGIPLYATFENLARSYKHVGKPFAEINEKMNLGTPLTDALNETIENCPSDELRKVFWQILNSLRIGSEVTGAVQNVLDQVVREQKIAVIEYGRKLNPLAMMYMMIAIIVPSLGTTMLVVMATFIGFELNMTILLILAGLLLFVQFMFLAIIRSSRPAVEL
jgi:pilus assembly protein TadC